LRPFLRAEEDYRQQDEMNATRKREAYRKASEQEKKTEEEKLSPLSAIKDEV
jgi:hypothetical protein